MYWKICQRYSGLLVHHRIFRQICGKNGWFHGKFTEIFRTNWKKWPISWQFSGHTCILLESDRFCTDLTKKRRQFLLFSEMTSVAETSTTYKHCFSETGSFAGKFEQLLWTIVCVCICLTARLFLTETTAPTTKIRFKYIVPTSIWYDF